LIDWKQYGLTNIPFLAIPAINIDSVDIRANGRLFCKEIAERPLEKMKQLILSESFPMIFLRTESEVLGNGKSALLAAAYWDLRDQGKNLLWSTATPDPKIRDLLSRILDSIVKEEKLKALREKLDPISSTKIQNILAAKTEKLGSSAIYAMLQLLSAKEYELTYVYSNIRRRIPVQSHADLFGAFLNLFYAIDEPRFTVFVDQFEIYVRCHRTASEQASLSEDLNLLHRAIGESTTLVVTIHPIAEGILRHSAPEFETFTRIEKCSVDLPKYDEEDLVKMVKYYLRAFRPEGYDGDEFHPFDEKVIRYAAHRTDMNPRDLISALRAGLVYGSFQKYAKIDEKFLMDHHKDMFGGLDNKWRDFKSGKFKYEFNQSIDFG